jgi:hypothetical protein
MGAMLAPGLHLGGVGVPVSLRHNDNGLSVVRIRGSSISTFVRYISRQLTTLAPTNEESAWAQSGKNFIGKKITSQLSASDVTRVVSLDTNNQA